MPYTLNGIGTHYYGRKNESKETGTCDQCGNTTTLASYDTREFFVFVFIPLIPLRKYRIFADCASCRRHKRMPLDDFNQHIATEVQPLRDAIRRAPRDPEARLALIGSLYGLQMSAEAERAARDAVIDIPDNAKLPMIAGQIAAARGDLPAAQNYLERSVQLDAGNADSQRSLGHIYLLQGQADMAIRPLEQARRLASGDLETLLLLADAYMRAQRWSDALNAYQQLASQGHTDKEILRRIGECKKNLGYPLSDEERKATRKWWPFGGRTKAYRPPSAGNRRQWLLASILVGIFAVGIGGAIWAAWHDSRNVPVHFDSVLSGVRVSVDGGQQFEIRNNAMVERTLAPGKHKVAVVRNDGSALETRTVEVRDTGTWDHLWNDPVYVYNVGGLRVYRRAVLGYAAKASDASYSETLVAMKPFIEVRADYVFVNAPQTMSVKQSSGRVSKSQFDIAREVTLVDYAVMKAGEGKANESKNALKTVIGIEPCHREARETFIGIALGANDHTTARDSATAWMTACPGDYIPASRVYQEARQAAGESNALLAEYRDRVASHPESAADHYLYGRLILSSTESMDHYRQAIRLDPKLSWAHGALAWELLGTGAYDEALAEYVIASEQRPDDDSLLYYYASAAIAARKTDDALARVEKKLKGAYIDSTMWDARWRLLLATENWERARKVNDELGKYADAETYAWRNSIQLFGLMNDRAALDSWIAEGRKRKSLNAAASAVYLEQLLADRKYAEMVKEYDALAPELVAQDRQLLPLYAAAAAILAGDTAEGTARAGAELVAIIANTEMPEATRRIYVAYASALTGRNDAASVLDVIRNEDVHLLKHAYYFLGARARANNDLANARMFFAKSAETSFDRAFPLLSARQLAM